MMGKGTGGGGEGGGVQGGEGGARGGGGGGVRGGGEVSGDLFCFTRIKRKETKKEHFFAIIKKSCLLFHALHIKSLKKYSKVTNTVGYSMCHKKNCSRPDKKKREQTKDLLHTQLIA